MKKSATKTVHIYDIGDGLELLNVCTKNPENGMIDRVNTFIGSHTRNEYVSVGRTEDLSIPGVIFSYSSYVREQDMLKNMYKDIYKSNIEAEGKVYDANGNLKYILKK